MSSAVGWEKEAAQRQSRCVAEERQCIMHAWVVQCRDARCSVAGGRQLLQKGRRDALECICAVAPSPP